MKLLATLHAIEKDQSVAIHYLHRIKSESTNVLHTHLEIIS